MFLMNQSVASEVRTNLVSFISTEVGEKSVLESTRHEPVLTKTIPIMGRESLSLSPALFS